VVSTAPVVAEVAPAPAPAMTTREVSTPPQAVVLEPAAHQVPATAAAVVITYVLVGCAPISDRATRRLERWVCDLLTEIGAQLGISDPRLAESGPAGFGRYLLEESAATAPLPDGDLLLLDSSEASDAAARGLSRRGDVVVIRAGS
jgi:hypothetical protein